MGEYILGMYLEKTFEQEKDLTQDFHLRRVTFR